MATPTATPATPLRVLMCAPDHYDIAYVINPWMEGQVGRVDLNKARQQWRALHELVASLTTVELLPSHPGLPDLTFTANAGLVCQGTVVPASFRVPERSGEEPIGVQWFQDQRLRVEELGPDQPFEGEGDALFQPGEPLLWAAYGIRSSIECHSWLSSVFRCEVISLRLMDPRFYHLDTAFLPLPGGRVVYWPAAFDEDSLTRIRQRIPASHRLEVREYDALQFACTALRIGTTLIAHACSAELQQRLMQWGFEVRTIDLSEFVLAGAGVKSLALLLDQDPGTGQRAGLEFPSQVRTTRLSMSGHILDTGKLNRVISAAVDAGLGCRVEKLEAGERFDQHSHAQLRVTAPTQERLDTTVAELITLGAEPIAQTPQEAHTQGAPKDGVAPEDFYSTTIYPTRVLIDGAWLLASGQRMDAMLVVDRAARTVRCRLMRDLRAGEEIVVGHQGIRVELPELNAHGEGFSFMSAGVSSERRVEHTVDELAWEIARCVSRGGKVCVVSGPVVIHTGGGPYLQQLIEHGFVHVLLTGNALPVHDIESSMFGTSLGVDLSRGRGVRGGHRHHLRAINRVRMAGSIAEAVEQGVITSGIMHSCVRHGVRYVLAGSIRDDGPLPDTLMDLVQAQSAYAEALQGCEIVLMLSTMLHSIGVGNMTPAGVKLVCVDINPAVVTKLADRGSIESVGIVTDVGLFMRLLAQRLCEPS